MIGGNMDKGTTLKRGSQIFNILLNVIHIIHSIDLYYVFVGFGRYIQYDQMFKLMSYSERGDYLKYPDKSRVPSCA
jgi:hypothetical protein